MSTAVRTPRLQARTRWSLAAKCPLAAALGGLGVEPAEPDERTKRIWHRGRLFGWMVAEQFAAKHGAKNVIREKAVPWPAGVLHSDVFVKTERLAVEVKSSTAPSSLLESAFMQLAGECHFDADADQGMLVLIDPVDLDERFLPFVLTPEWAEKVETRAAEVVRALVTRGDDMPGCSCATPGACRFSGCPFTTEAWADWTPPTAEQLGHTPGILTSLSDLDTVKVARSSLSAQDKELKQRQDDIQAVLVELGVEPGRDYLFNGYRVKRTLSDSERFSLSTARQSGVWTPEDDDRLGAFINSGSSERWTVKRTEAATPSKVTVDDFGEDTPF